MQIARPLRNVAVRAIEKGIGGESILLWKMYNASKMEPSHWSGLIDCREPFFMVIQSSEMSENHCHTEGFFRDLHESDRNSRFTFPSTCSKLQNGHATRQGMHLLPATSNPCFPGILIVLIILSLFSPNWPQLQELYNSHVFWAQQLASSSGLTEQVVFELFVRWTVKVRTPKN